MSKVQCALNEGKIPFSVIATAQRYCQLEGLQHVTVADLFDHIKDTDPMVLFDRYGLSEARQVVAMLDTLEVVGNMVSDEVLPLNLLEMTGWQVDVDVFKASGKFAYSGIVSLGQANAFDALLPIIVHRQNFMTVLNPDHYAIVVNDTRANDDDLNYTRCGKRLFIP